MKRHLNILLYFLISMRRHWKWHLGIVAIFAFVVFAYASVVFFIQALSHETKIVLENTPDLMVQRIEGGRLVPLSLVVGQEIGRIRGIKTVVPRIWGYYFDSPTGGVFTLLGSDSLNAGLSLVRGQGIVPGDSGVVICGTGFLETHQLKLGDDLFLFDPRETLHNFRIIGAFTAPSDLLTRDLVVLPRADARRILGLQPNQATDLALFVHNDSEIENISRKIDRRFPSLRVVTKSEIRSTYEALFGYRGGLFLFGLLISLLAFLILAWQKATGISAEARREIGILKAIGWDVSDVLILKFWEGLSISLTSTLLGLLLAYLHVFWWEAPLIKPFMVGWSIIYPRFKLLPVIEIGSVALILVLAVIPYTAATIVPSWKAAVTDPAEVMHA